MWHEIRLALARLGFWIWFKSSGYYHWSKFWRWALERKYKKQKLTQYAHLKQLVAALNHIVWQEDPLKGYFDVISSPQKVERIFQLARLQDERPRIGDCDDFAQYAADRIEDLRRRRVVNIVPYFMTINWFDKSGVFHGHNVCALEKTDDKGNVEWGHVGNWYAGSPQWGFSGPHDIAYWFAYRNPRDGHGQLIAWALASFNLELKELRVWNV